MSLLERVDRARPSFAASLADHGSRLAIATGSTTLTYAELAERVDRVADALGEARRLVLLTGADELDAVVGYLAALRGGHPVLLAAPESDAHLARLIDAFDPDVLMTECTGWQIDERRHGSAHELHPELALLLSTSGTTGLPRLVRLSRRNVESNATAIAEYLELTPSDRGATTLPMHYCYGLSIINSHLATGAGLVLTDCSVVDRCFWRAFHRHRVTGLAGVPHTFDLLDRVGFDTMTLPSLRYVTQAGGRLAPDRVQRYVELGERDGWDLFVMYGQTEATA
ncbi:MAG: AMP-binding protein, partial [Acidimicrobiales bacterium]